MGWRCCSDTSLVLAASGSMGVAGRLVDGGWHGGWQGAGKNERWGEGAGDEGAGVAQKRAASCLEQHCVGMCGLCDRLWCRLRAHGKVPFFGWGNTGMRAGEGNTK